MRPGFTHYVALGDSISIDDYPGLAHMEAIGSSAPTPGLGAAALFLRNADALWPELAGRDLARLYPGIEADLLCFDGATTAAVLEHQIPALDAPPDEPTLVTLTAGGNDLLGLLMEEEVAARRRLEEAGDRLATILARLRERLPHGVVLLSTVYDPTDATGELDALRVPIGRMAFLDRFNERVRALARADGVELADLHAHFRGHGRAAPPEDRWYWRHATIEPGLRGASEVRRVWLGCLERAGLC